MFYFPISFTNICLWQPEAYKSGQKPKNNYNIHLQPFQIRTNSKTETIIYLALNIPGIFLQSWFSPFFQCHVNPQMTVTQPPEGLYKSFSGVQGAVFQKSPPVAEGIAN